jgi:mannose-6-phosphate isomerase-like protein (cupin superfamily)
MAGEARLNETDAGLVVGGEGWFVMNLEDARWLERPGQGYSLPLTGIDDFEVETYFPMLGISLRVMRPGEPSTTYHWEHEQEDFLVLAGEVVLLVEGEERPLRRWDFVHCPPGTRHAFAGAGDGPCALLCMASRQHQTEGEWGGYIADPVAARYNASPPVDTADPELAYARFPPPRPIRYPGGLLPEM